MKIRPKKNARVLFGSQLYCLIADKEREVPDEVGEMLLSQSLAARCVDSGRTAQEIDEVETVEEL